MRTDNNPQSRFSEQLNARLFINHPYRTPIIGWMHEIEKLTRADAKSYYETWYAPNNAILVVAGDVTPAQVYTKAIEIYGPIEKHPLPDRNYTQSPESETEIRLTMNDKAVREPTFYKLYRVPSAVQDKEASLALDVLSEIMGGGPSSRLYQALVTKQKIASGVGMSYDGTRRDDAVLSIYAVPVQGTSIEKVENALMAELKKIAKNGVSEDEFKRAITSMQDSAIYARDSLSGPAMIIGQGLAAGLSLDDIEYWPDDLNAVTREQVQMMAKHVFAPEQPPEILPVTGLLLPEDPEKTEAEATAAETPAEEGQ